MLCLSSTLMLFFAKSTVYSGSPSGPSSAQVKCLIEERYAQTPQDQAPETTLVNMVLQTQNRRQQANAIVAARARIVEGAVGMVEMALELLSHREIVQLDNERKAAMVSNLVLILSLPLGRA